MSRSARNPLLVLAGLAAVALFAVQIRGLFGAEGAGGRPPSRTAASALATASATGHWQPGRQRRRRASSRRGASPPIPAPRSWSRARSRGRS